VCESALICQDATDIWCDFLAGLFLRFGRDGDGGIFVVLLVQLIQLGLDCFLLFCADFSGTCALLSCCPSFSSFERLELRFDIWHVGPSLGSALLGGDWKLVDNRHLEA
jgi:hypothetical protein